MGCNQTAVGRLADRGETLLSPARLKRARSANYHWLAEGNHVPIIMRWRRTHRHRHGRAVAGARMGRTDELEPIIVTTATRTAITADESLAPVTVITREDVERTPALDVADLLNVHANIDVARNGGFGQPVSTFLRGANSNHTLVLVDGVRVNPGTIGLAALQNIDPAHVERIEVVRGPRSALYGSDAIGGVMNVITRVPSEGSRWEASLGAGNYGARSGGRLSVDPVVSGGEGCR
jgi:outer membrane cobalamin receptor